MVQGWFKMRKFLTLKQGKWDLPEIGCRVLMHIKSGNGWTDLTTLLQSKQITLSEQQRREIQILQTQLSRIDIGTQRQQQSRSWKWEGIEQPWKGWGQKTSFWRRLIMRDEELEDLSTKWPEHQHTLTWKQRWQLLWSKGGTLRNKLWMWRILTRCFFTRERATKMKVSLDPCKRCDLEVETTSHLFWSCSEVQPLWRSLQRRLFLANAQEQLQSNLLAIIDAALQKKPAGGILTHIIPAAVQSIWEDRNTKYFRGRRHHTPITVVLQNAKRELEATMHRKTPSTSWDKQLCGLQDLQSLIDVREEHSVEELDLRQNAEADTSSNRHTPSPPAEHIARPTEESLADINEE
ncbi:hypothetical protein R1sor_008585 [Riccia sorocarpa]|uniref:Reverse transcriptase zinc-binding domain-containing protein n=1 Tax=Riccia sorocarpa TaxID=122646 RepID=A0ABD3HXA3_9MARC